MPNWWVMPTHSGSMLVLPAPRGQVWRAGAGEQDLPQRWHLLEGNGSLMVPWMLPPHTPLAVATGKLCRQRQRGT